MASSKTTQALVQAPAFPVQAPAPTPISRALKAYIDQHTLAPALDAQTPKHRREQLALASRTEAASQVIKGYWLCQILEAEGKEAMVQAAAEVHTGARAAFYSVSYFKVFNSIGDLDAIQALSTLDYTKVLLLGLDAESATALAQGERVAGLALDEVRQMSSRELEKEVREYRLHDEELRKAKNEAETLRNHVTTAKNELERVLKGAELRAEHSRPIFVQAARDGFIELTARMEVCVEGLEQILRDLTTGPAVRESLHCGRAIGALYHSFMGILARAADLGAAIREAAPGEVGPVPAAVQRYSKAELKHFRDNRDRMLSEEADEAEARHVERANAKPGRKGRKLKSRKDKS